MEAAEASLRWMEEEEEEEEEEGGKSVASMSGGRDERTETEGRGAAMEETNPLERELTRCLRPRRQRGDGEIHG
jgi:hypothetical protein